MRMIFAPLLVASLASHASTGASPEECVPLQDWRDVPADARASLEKLVGQVAAKHEDFNATDLLVGDLPLNRFMSGCQQPGLVAVSLERGGRGYSVQVFHFIAGKVARRWTYLDSKDPSSINLLKPPFDASLESLARELRDLRALPVGAPANARCPNELGQFVGLKQIRIRNALGEPDAIDGADTTWTYFFSSPLSAGRYGGGHPELSFSFESSGKVANVSCRYSR